MSIRVKIRDREYKSLRACARDIGVCDATLRYIMKTEHVTAEQAVAIALRKAHGRRVIDKKGRVYRSVRAACRAYGVQHELVRRYMLLGKSFDEAAKLVIRNRTRYAVKDADGNKYASFKAMCKAYGVPYQSALDLRHKLKSPVKAIEAALEIERKKEAQI